MDFLIYTALPLAVLAIPVVLYIVGAFRRAQEPTPEGRRAAPSTVPPATTASALGDPHDDWDPASIDPAENPTREGPLRVFDEFFRHDPND